MTPEKAAAESTFLAAIREAQEHLTRFEMMNLVEQIMGNGLMPKREQVPHRMPTGHYPNPSIRDTDGHTQV